MTLVALLASSRTYGVELRRLRHQERAASEPDSPDLARLLYGYWLI